MRLLNSLISIIVLLVFVNGSIAVSGECSLCYGEGEKCMVEVSPTYYKSGGNCRDGLICAAKNTGEDEKNWICMKAFEQGEKCTGENSCSVGLICDEEGICLDSRFASIGESCSKVSDCSSTLATCSNGICTPPSDGKCNDPNDCKYGSSCNQNVCVDGIPSGQTCDPAAPHCYFGLVCTAPESTPTTFTCGPMFQKSLGAHCQSNDECNLNQNLICSTKSKVCEKYIDQTTSGNCTADSSICDEYHSCLCTDGKCYQSGPLPTQYASAFAPLVECILENKCQFGGNMLSSKSCLSKNCGAKFCAYGTSLVTDNPLQCGNTHQAEKYCDANSSLSAFNSNILLILITSVVTLLL